MIFFLLLTAAGVFVLGHNVGENWTAWETVTAYLLLVIVSTLALIVGELQRLRNGHG